MPALRLALVALLLAPLAACDSGRDGLSSGEFTAEITGGLERSLDGRATFRTETDFEDAPVRAFAMTSALGLRQISFFGPESLMSVPGTYSVGFGEG
jgi:hypothetical protein